MKTLTISLLAAFAVAGTSFAGTVVTSKEYKQPVVVPCFQDQEFSMDLFYSFNNAVNNHHTGSRTTTASGVDAAGNLFDVTVEERRPQYFRDGSGGGVGLNYFFARYFGLGVEGNWWLGANSGGSVDATVVTTTPGGIVTTTTASDSHIHHSATHQVTGNLIFRYPFEGPICWAPYIFGGGGGVWDGKSTGFGDAGLGVEFRLTPKFGIFTDWRWNFMCNRNDVNTSRAGIRFVF